MKVQDDRTEREKQTHRYLVIGTDRFLSGWGQADGGKSYAVWACTHEKYRDTLCWVERRGDMTRVRTTYDGDGRGRYRPKGRGHCHIYVVRDDSPRGD